MIINLSTEKIALYGAITATISIIVSTASVIFQAISVIRDKKNIEIKYSKDNRVYNQNILYPYKENTDYISIDIINKGRRPATIINCGINLYTKKKWLATDLLINGQVVLNEGQKKTVLIEQKMINFDEIYYFFAIDATNEEHKNFVGNIFIRFFKKIVYFIKNKIISN